MTEMTKTHYPPSRRRYVESHPTISVHVSKEEHMKLKEIASSHGKSINQILKEAAGIAGSQLDKEKSSYREGYNTGVKDRTDEFARGFKCEVCGKPLDLLPTMEDTLYKFLVEMSEKVGHPAHISCRHK